MAKSNLKPGLSVVDYSSYNALFTVLGSEQAIRNEYSRMRSIIRKRVERMAAAGETHNWVYRNFGDMPQQLPSAIGKSTKELAQIMAAQARVLSGGYQSTVREIRQSRKQAIRDIAKEAKEAGDIGFAEMIKKITPQQYERAKRLMGMMQSAIGKAYQSSEEVWQDALKVSLSTNSKSNLLTEANKLLADYGLDDVETLSSMKSRFTAKGTTRQSWKRANSGRKRR